MSSTFTAAAKLLVTVANRPGGIRILTLDNPPANALSFILVAELIAAVEAADADPGSARSSSPEPAHV